MSISQTLRVSRVPNEADHYTNLVYVNSANFDATKIKSICFYNTNFQSFTFTIRNSDSIQQGNIAFSDDHREWAGLQLDEMITVYSHGLFREEIVGSMSLSADLRGIENVDFELMSKEFLRQFEGHRVVVGMPMNIRFTSPSDQKFITVPLTVKTVQRPNQLDLVTSQKEAECGRITQDSLVFFDEKVAKDEDSTKFAKPHNPKSKAGKRFMETRNRVYGSLYGPNQATWPKSVDYSNMDFSGWGDFGLTGAPARKPVEKRTSPPALLNPSWDFNQLGIGGLDKEFSNIFRRAFASRVFPPDFIEQLGMKHVRGILLYGPPGTGKTLMARQIGKMLNAKEPKIVNGPEIFGKWIGDSEGNIRKLFADAEEDWKVNGKNSDLHIIIFDEIDAICRHRGQGDSGSSNVNDKVVNQLLSKLDGVDQLNNILVIGMTNRRDMLDEALLRPGRLEVQMEVSLPDEQGRLQILKIHTEKMTSNKRMGDCVDLENLAKRTKNYSGAELEGLVRAAQSSAMNRLVTKDGKTDAEAVKKMMVVGNDFEAAMDNDIKAAFGRSDDTLNRFSTRGLIPWGPDVSRILDEGRLLVNTVKNPDDDGFYSAILVGAPKTGKTSLAAEIAKSSDFPFVRVISPKDIMGCADQTKCGLLKKAYDDALKSKLSLLLFDNLEILIGYNPIGPSYSNSIIQCLKSILNENPPTDHHLLVLATSTEPEFLKRVGLLDAFGKVIRVPKLKETEEMMNVIKTSKWCTDDDIVEIQKHLEEKDIQIGVKHLLELLRSAGNSQPENRVNNFLREIDNLID